MTDKLVEIVQKEDACTKCAAYPCFRNPGKNDSGAMCFQKIRQCRQECDFYNYKQFPASGGVCRKDNKRVEYLQECHIEEMKYQKKQTT